LSCLGDELNSIGSGSTFTAVSVDQIKNLRVPSPPISEQRRIASYLDGQIQVIRAIAAKLERLIELLKEQRAAIINEAVTKGLNPDVKMKDSGIEWLGEIPEHWVIKRFKHLPCRIGDGIHATPNYVDSSDIYFINGNNLDNGKISIYENTGLVNEEEYSKLGISLRIGTILISINGTIGNLAIYRDEKIILGKSAAYIECPNHIYNMFIYYYLQSSFVNNYFRRSFSGTTIDNLSLETLRNTQIPVPLLLEQKRIVEHLDQEMAKTDQYVTKINRQIELLQEYRTALISEAVTGKIDVREE